MDRAHNQDLAAWKRFLQGDREGLNELVVRYQDRLFSYLVGIVGRKEAAEDLVQEVFVKILGRPGLFRLRGSFAGWLFRVAHNLAVDHIRKQSRRVASGQWSQVPVEAVAGTDPAPDQRAMAAEDEARLEKALQQLTVEQRQVVLLRTYGQLSFREIARITGSPLGTVLGRMHDALRKLRRILGPLARERWLI